MITEHQLDLIVERAAIIEYDAGQTRHEAEKQAMQLVTGRPPTWGDWRRLREYINVNEAKK